VGVAPAVRLLNFGSAENHGITWILNNNLPAETTLKLSVRNIRFLTSEQMTAEGGKMLNSSPDVNADKKVDAVDYQSVLNIISTEGYTVEADTNKDGTVDAADYQYILNVIGTQE
jgi:hypothetical protein